MRSREFDDELARWGHGNVAQGAVLHSDYVTFDPLLEGCFGAVVYLRISDAFSIDGTCRRCIVAPFRISNREKLRIGSVPSEVAVLLDFKEDLYAAYFRSVREMRSFISSHLFLRQKLWGRAI
ncbi:MAG: hypothetical protein FWD68_15680 [Alphaproteobacteria bacterium]|nr:hypothetical protein [Alphaproteobacteria bacterium]